VESHVDVNTINVTQALHERQFGDVDPLGIIDLTEYDRHTSADTVIAGALSAVRGGVMVASSSSVVPLHVPPLIMTNHSGGPIIPLHESTHYLYESKDHYIHYVVKEMYNYIKDAERKDALILFGDLSVKWFKQQHHQYHWYMYDDVAEEKELTSIIMNTMILTGKYIKCIEPVINTYDDLKRFGVTDYKGFELEVGNQVPSNDLDRFNALRRIRPHSMDQFRRQYYADLCVICEGMYRSLVDSGAIGNSFMKYEQLLNITEDNPNAKDFMPDFNYDQWISAFDECLDLLREVHLIDVCRSEHDWNRPHISISLGYTHVNHHPGREDIPRHFIVERPVISPALVTRALQTITNGKYLDNVQLIIHELILHQKVSSTLTIRNFGTDIAMIDKLIICVRRYIHAPERLSDNTIDSILSHIRYAANLSEMIKSPWSDVPDNQWYKWCISIIISELIINEQTSAFLLRRRYMNVLPHEYILALPSGITDRPYYERILLYVDWQLSVFVNTSRGGLLNKWQMHDSLFRYCRSLFRIIKWTLEPRTQDFTLLTLINGLAIAIAPAASLCGMMMNYQILHSIVYWMYQCGEIKKDDLRKPPQPMINRNLQWNLLPDDQKLLRLGRGITPLDLTDKPEFKAIRNYLLDILKAHPQSAAGVLEFDLLRTMTHRFPTSNPTDLYVIMFGLELRLTITRTDDAIMNQFRYHYRNQPAGLITHMYDGFTYPYTYPLPSSVMAWNHLCPNRSNDRVIHNKHFIELVPQTTLPRLQAQDVGHGHDAAGAASAVTIQRVEDIKSHLSRVRVTNEVKGIIDMIYVEVEGGNSIHRSEYVIAPSPTGRSLTSPLSVYRVEEFKRHGVSIQIRGRLMIRPDDVEHTIVDNGRQLVLKGRVQLPHLGLAELLESDEDQYWMDANQITRASIDVDICPTGDIPLPKYLDKLRSDLHVLGLDTTPIINGPFFVRSCWSRLHGICVMPQRIDRFSYIRDFDIKKNAKARVERGTPTLSSSSSVYSYGRLSKKPLSIEDIMCLDDPDRKTQPRTTATTTTRTSGPRSDSKDVKPSSSLMGGRTTRSMSKNRATAAPMSFDPSEMEVAMQRSLQTDEGVKREIRESRWILMTRMMIRHYQWAFGGDHDDYNRRDGNCFFDAIALQRYFSRARARGSLSDDEAHMWLTDVHYRHCLQLNVRYLFVHELLMHPYLYEPYNNAPQAERFLTIAWGDDQCIQATIHLWQDFYIVIIDDFASNNDTPEIFPIADVRPPYSGGTSVDKRRYINLMSNGNTTDDEFEAFQSNHRYNIQGEKIEGRNIIILLYERQYHEHYNSGVSSHLINISQHYHHRHLNDRNWQLQEYSRLNKEFGRYSDGVPHRLTPFFTSLLTGSSANRDDDLKCLGTSPLSDHVYNEWANQDRPNHSIAGARAAIAGAAAGVDTVRRVDDDEGDDESEDESDDGSSDDDHVARDRVFVLCMAFVHETEGIKMERSASSGTSAAGWRDRCRLLALAKFGFDIVVYTTSILFLTLCYYYMSNCIKGIYTYI
jgi:hypothetical protein